MEPNEHQIKQLFSKYIAGTLTEEELNEFLQYFWADEYEHIFKELLQSNFDGVTPEGISRERIDRITRRVDDTVFSVVRSEKKKFPIYRWLSIAAAAIVLIFGSYLFFNHNEEQPTLVAETIEDIDPGTNRATLTLEDGNAVVLNEDQIGITIGSDGISYMDGTKITENTGAQYAILSTPRKGQYQTTLPDGSKVWLNAESSLRYPTAFTRNERRVELKGEGYFEIAHNASQPFIVESASQRIKVLGTEFNINAYDNEPVIATTLVNGSIALNRIGDKTINTIMPGQQALLGKNDFRIEPVDIAPYIAWKEGEFRFKDTPLKDALRQIERWYDIQVDYSNVPENIEIYASIKRDKKLSSVIFALEEITNIKFKVQERRLMLME